MDHALAARAFQNGPDGRLGADYQPGLARRTGDGEYSLIHSPAEWVVSSVSRPARRPFVPPVLYFTGKIMSLGIMDAEQIVDRGPVTLNGMSARMVGV